MLQAFARCLVLQGYPPTFSARGTEHVATGGSVGTEELWRLGAATDSWLSAPSAETSFVGKWQSPELGGTHDET